jgi:hypothetical protein
MLMAIRAVRTEAIVCSDLRLKGKAASEFFRPKALLTRIATSRYDSMSDSPLASASMRR